MVGFSLCHTIFVNAMNSTWTDPFLLNLVVKAVVEVSEPPFCS